MDLLATLMLVIIHSLPVHLHTHTHCPFARAVQYSLLTLLRLKSFRIHACSAQGLCASLKGGKKEH